MQAAQENWGRAISNSRRLLAEMIVIKLKAYKYPINKGAMRQILIRNYMTELYECVCIK